MRVPSGLRFGHQGRRRRFKIGRNIGVPNRTEILLQPRHGLVDCVGRSNLVASSKMHVVHPHQGLGVIDQVLGFPRNLAGVIQTINPRDGQAVGKDGVIVVVTDPAAKEQQTGGFVPVFARGGIGAPGTARQARQVESLPIVRNPPPHVVHDLTLHDGLVGNHRVAQSVGAGQNPPGGLATRLQLAQPVPAIRTRIEIQHQRRRGV